MRGRQGRLGALLAALLAAAACQAPRPTAAAATAAPAQAPPLRLAELAQAPPGAAGSPPAAPWASWSFAPPVSGRWRGLQGWRAERGIGQLRLAAAGLAGRTTSRRAVLRLAHPLALPRAERLRSVEIRARVPAGGRLAIAFAHSPGQVRRMLASEDPLTWPLSIPLVADAELRTYVLTAVVPVDSAAIQHLLVRPTDRDHARFEIASIRLVFAREALAAIPEGVGWYGLGDVYETAVASRSPRRRTLRVTLPPHPVLETSVGTVEPGATTFLIGVKARGAAPGGAMHALQRTVTSPERWEPLALDLADLGGRQVEITLAVTGRPGALGLWGNPVVRARGPAPAAAAAAAAAAAGPPQGVILILADSLRRDHLAAYGYGRQTAPAISRLAREGVRFLDCMSQASWTKVSTASLMTALYPGSHHVLDFSDRLSPATPTLPRAFFAAGYATLSLSSILLTGRFSNLHLGFEEVRESSSFPDQGSSKTARPYVETAVDWLARHREDRFFLFLHLFDPHDPYRPEPPYDTLWHARAAGARHQREARLARRAIADPLLRRFTMPTAGELGRAGVSAPDYAAFEEDWYDGSILGMDAEIGRLVERLRELGLDRRTLVVFTSDHGEEFLEHGRSFHGQSLYGELTAVPLVFWWPGGLPAGRAVPETVELIDVMPTVLELSGLALPAGLQGASLVPLLGRPAPPPGGRAAGAWPGRAAYAEKAAVREALSPPPRQTEAFAIVAGGWKLIHNTRRAAQTAEYELFDHLRDPLDRRDLAAAEPLVVRQLARRLLSWRQTVRAAPGPPLPSRGEARLGNQDLERLRALGYL